MLHLKPVSRANERQSNMALKPNHRDWSERKAMSCIWEITINISRYAQRELEVRDRELDLEIERSELVEWILSNDLFEIHA